MDVKEFRKLCGSLNELTGPQLKDLLAALKSLDAGAWRDRDTA
jgi:hypothetical protein